MQNDSIVAALARWKLRMAQGCAHLHAPSLAPMLATRVHSQWAERTWKRIAILCKTFSDVSRPCTDVEVLDEASPSGPSACCPLTWRDDELEPLAPADSDFSGTGWMRAFLRSISGPHP